MYELKVQPQEIYEKNQLVNHKLVQSFIQRSESFFSNPNSLRYMTSQAETIFKGFESKDYFVAGIGFAYPYYILGADETTLNEVNNFHYKIRDIHTEEAEKNPNGWVCSSCKDVNELTDFKTFCKKCSFSVLKPRDLFRMLPDIDVILIVNEVNEDLKKEAKSTLVKKNFVTMDYSVSEILEKVANSFKDIENGTGNDVLIPVDFHICTMDDFKQATFISIDDLSYKIPRMSLHADWESNPLPFFINAVFSFNIVNSSNEDFNKLLYEFFHKVKEKYTIEELVSIFSKQSERLERLFKEDIIMDNFVKRYNSW